MENTNGIEALETLMKDKTPEETELLLSLANQLLKMTQQPQKKVEKATKEEWKEINRSDHVVTKGSELKVQTKSKKTISDLEDLVESARTKKHLTGTIVGVRSISLESDPDGSKAKALEEAKAKNANTVTESEIEASKIKDVSTWVAEVQYGNDTCTILIPSYELYAYKVTDRRTVESEEIIHNHMMDMVGTEIEFVVLRVLKGKKQAFASRLQALDDNIWSNYIRETRSGNGKRRIEVGSIVEAQVVAVRSRAIIVDVGGAETVLTAAKDRNNLSWGYIEDCRDHFHKNDIIMVKVKAIEIKEHKVYTRKYKIANVQVSHKETIENPIDVYWDDIYEGEIGLATITSIHEARVFCKYKNRVDILCKMPTHGTVPYVGETRKVQITIKKNEPGQGKRIFGIFKAD